MMKLTTRRDVSCTMDGASSRHGVHYVALLECYMLEDKPVTCMISCLTLPHDDKEGEFYNYQLKSADL